MPRHCVLMISAMLLVTPAALAQQVAPPTAIPPIVGRTQGMKKLDGYFPLYWDERTVSLFLEIAQFDTEFLFTNGLSAGLGSNDIGLDRGRSGDGEQQVLRVDGGGEDDPGPSCLRDGEALDRSHPPGCRWRPIHWPYCHCPATV